MRSLKSSFAGQFYPAQPHQLSDLINRFLSVPVKRNLHPRAILVPHAGYVYSGQTAAYGYKELLGEPYRTAIVLGPSHQVYSSILAVPDADAYETPLGALPFNQPLYQSLLSKGIVQVNSAPHAREHSMEVQFPFLQIIHPNIQIVPMSVGNIDIETLREAGKKIADLLSPEIILIISTDLSHYHTLALAESIDQRTVNALLAMESLPLIQASQSKDMECCGLFPILLAFEIFKHFEQKITATPLFYDTSATASFDDQHVVGYVSIAFG